MRPERDGVMGGFMNSLMSYQKIFESVIVGVDGTLAERNTLEYIAQRGVVGELGEFVEAVGDGDLEAAKMEAVDVLIFTASLFNHLGMGASEVERLALQKMATNFLKYPAPLFEGKTIDEGMRYCKDTWEERVKQTWTPEKEKEFYE